MDTLHPNPWAAALGVERGSGLNIEQRGAGNGAAMNQSEKLTRQFPPGVFLAAVEQSSVAISITDAEAKILYVNAAFCEVTGYSLAEALGRNESILSDKNTPHEIYQEMWSHLVARRPWSGRLVNRRKDGTRYLADLTISPVTDVVNGSLYFLGMHRDVTALHRLVRELRNQKLLVETVMNSTPVALALLDTEQRVVFDNAEYKRVATDLGDAEPARRALENLRALSGMMLDPGLLSGCAPEETLSGREIELSCADGASRWYACSVRCFEEEDARADAFFDPRPKRFLLLAMSDITQARRQQEQERLNALRAVLAESERVQQLREAIAGAIFQMQMPLNLIGAASSMLARQQSGGDFQALKGVLAQALAAGQSALETLRQGMPPEPLEEESMLNLNMLLREVLALLTESILAAGIVVDWQPAYALPPVRGRATQLRQMFKQLVQNAIDSMRSSRSALRELRIVSERRDGTLLVSISDSGAGIPQELRRKVFEPFFTTRRAGGGHVGMGLTLAQDAAARHGGWLEIDNDYAPGCRILVGLPFSAPSPGIENAAQRGETS
ncbi:MAG: nitrogen fixation negative regulator NifL [Pseudomonadota bacterium]